MANQSSKFYVYHVITGFRENDDFFLSYATKVDLKEKMVEMRSNDEAKTIARLSYDRLVIGVGALTNTFNVPGAEQHAFFLKVAIKCLQFNLHSSLIRSDSICP